MRIRLIDATIELLMERGWADMSTNDVVRRARVSRGALTHHFRSKAALMDAAAGRLIGTRAEEFGATFRDLPPAGRTVDAALDLLWSYFRGPTFAAVLELIVAARTNPDLRAAVADAPERVLTASFAVFQDLFPAVSASPNALLGLRFALTLMTGLAVEQMLQPEATDHSDEALAWMKTFARSLGLTNEPAESESPSRR